jgi:3-phosphoglycerate kinase
MKRGFSDKMTHATMVGGAILRLPEGTGLPVVEVLLDKNS